MGCEYVSGNSQSSYFNGNILKCKKVLESSQYYFFKKTTHIISLAKRLIWKMFLQRERLNLTKRSEELYELSHNLR